MGTITLKCIQSRDELDGDEEFTSDLGDICMGDFRHIGENGLPCIGTRIVPGMILVGKIGRRCSYVNKISRIEMELTLSEGDSEKDYWNRMIYDSSLYCPDGVSGVVVSSWFETVDHMRVAVVTIEVSPRSKSPVKKL